MRRMFQILCIFVLLLISISCEAIHDTKKQRGHTSASLAVIFELRLDVGSSDPLHSFYKINLFMLPTNDYCSKTALSAISADEILSDLLITDDISRMRQHLRQALDNYLLSEEELRIKKQVYSTFLALDVMLCKSESIKERGVL